MAGVTDGVAATDTHGSSRQTAIQARTFSPGSHRRLDQGTSVAHLTFGTRLRLASKPNIRCKCECSLWF